MQINKIILWKKTESKDKSFEEIAKEAYSVLMVFKEYPMLRPKYLPALSQDEVRTFSWEFNEFKDILAKCINQEDGKVFEDLGYHFSCFSSMDDMSSCRLDMSVGIKNDKFMNVLAVDLPYSLDLSEKENADLIKKLFCEIVDRFCPFWGCVLNRAILRSYGRLFKGDLPSTIHWVNYWNENIAEQVGKEKIEKIVQNHPDILWENNFLIVKETALSSENRADLNYQRYLHKMLFD